MWKQSTGHTSTQSVCKHLIQSSVTTYVIWWLLNGKICETVKSEKIMPL